jgi:hypothetical protein
VTKAKVEERNKCERKNKKETITPKMKVLKVFSVGLIAEDLGSTARVHHREEQPN